MSMLNDPLTAVEYGPERTPSVPNEVEFYLDMPQVLQSSIEGQNDIFGQLKRDMCDTSIVEEITIPLSDTENLRALRFPALKHNFRHEGRFSATVFGLPYNQGWKPSMYLRAKKMQQIAAPDEDLIVFPDDHRYVEYSDNDLKILKESGSIMPAAEKRAKALEWMDYPAYRLTGGSYDGLVTLGVLAAAPDVVIEAVNIDEMPFGNDPISKRFAESSTPKQQRNAIDDSQLKPLKQALNFPRLGLDYGVFFSKHFSKLSVAKRSAMSGLNQELIRKALQQSVYVKLGHVAGSHMFDEKLFTSAFGDLIQDDQVRYYTGIAARGHAIVDNPVANALMTLDGFDRAFTNSFKD